MFEESQESLALALGSSPRHISRMENGRVRPSVEMVHRLAEHFGLRPPDTHQLLFAAGYAALPESVSFDDPRLRWTRKGAAHALAAFEPHPAVIMDGAAQIQMANRGWLDLVGPALPAVGPFSIALHFDVLLGRVPDEARPRNWEDMRSALVMSLQQEATLSGEPAQQALVDELVVRHALPADWARRALAVEPLSTFVVPLRVGGEVRWYTHLSVDVGPRGPTSPLATPRLLLMALLPRTSASDESDHPLHVGHWL